MSNYTPGKWRTGDMYHTVFATANDKPTPETIATIMKGNKANAQRIVDCVNACEGINPEAVPEMLKLVKMLGTERNPNIYMAIDQAMKILGTLKRNKNE